MKTILALLMMVLSAAAHGQLMKCTSKDGKVVYANNCPPDTTAQQIDILPTILKEIGGDPRGLRGASLFDVAKNGTDRTLFSLFWGSNKMYFMVWSPPWALFETRRKDGSVRTLCRTDTDPGCFADVAAQHPQEVERLKTTLEQHEKELGTTKWETSVLSADEKEQLRDLGYMAN